MQRDPEIKAMIEVFESFENLDKGQRKRIIDWITARFKLTYADRFIQPTSHTMVEVEDLPAEDDAEKPGKKSRLIQQKDFQDDEPTAATPSGRERTSKKRDITDYETVLDLFAETKVKKTTSKIILMAAFLQEKLRFKEITSYEINSRLKRIKYGVTNVTSALNSILKKDPPMLIELDNGGDNSKKSRRRFKVTEEGLKFARALPS